jgi:zinc/manganese transport system ATP-binding protein
MPSETSSSRWVPLLRVENLTYWRGPRLLFRDISFSVNPGEFIGLHDDDHLSGRALAYILMGWSFPTSGAIFWGNRPLKIPEDRKHITFVSDFAEEPVYGNAGDYLYDVALAGGVSRRDAGERVATLVEALSLAQLRRFRDRHFRELDLFRIRLARALLFQPSLVIIDGRQNGLDPDSLDGAIATLQGLLGPALIVIVLNPFPSVTSLHRVLKISRGRLVAESEGVTEPVVKALAIECDSLPEGVRAFLARIKIRAEPSGNGFRLVAPDDLAQECIRRLAAEGAKIRVVSPAVLQAPSGETAGSEEKL